MKLFLSMALALVGWVAAAHQAAATTITIDPNPVAFVGDLFGSKDPVSNAYEFSFTGVADGWFGAKALGIKNFTASICLNATCSGPDATVVAGSTASGPFGLFSLAGGSISGLVGGTYYLVITGFSSFFGGGYFGAISLNVSPVPLPGALLMFLTALGGLGAFKTFRRKSSAAA
jgi:hypothetical protein